MTLEIKVKVGPDGSLYDEDGNGLMLPLLSRHFVLEAMTTTEDGRRVSIRDLIRERMGVVNVPLCERCGARMENPDEHRCPEAECDAVNPSARDAGPDGLHRGTSFDPAYETNEATQTDPGSD